MGLYLGIDCFMRVVHLRKWKIQFPNRSISDLVKEAKTAADVIRNIDDALTDLKFDWT